jgi:hypothetical protein
VPDGSTCEGPAIPLSPTVDQPSITTMPATLAARAAVVKLNCSRSGGCSSRKDVRGLAARCSGAAGCDFERFLALRSAVTVSRLSELQGLSWKMVHQRSLWNGAQSWSEASPPLEPPPHRPMQCLSNTPRPSCCEVGDRCSATQHYILSSCTSKIGTQSPLPPAP